MKTTKADLEWAFSEVVAELEHAKKEIKELKLWKEGAMHVMPDFQAIGNELELEIGADVSPQILPKIRNLKQQICILGTALDLKQRALNEMGDKVNQLTGEGVSREAEKITASSPAPNPPCPETSSVLAQP